jgi:hypothetical protein
MSTVVSKNVQIGADGTASNNFTAYQPAAPDGTLRIGNGNSGSVTDAITLTSAGNVGIGTSSPQVQLHLQSDAPVIRLTDTTANTNAEIFCNSAAGSMYLRADKDNTAANSVIGFQIDGSDKMTLDSSGNLGLGVSPSAWGGSYKAFQFSSSGSVSGNTGISAFMANNAYSDGGTFRYITSAITVGAQLFGMNPNGSGGYAFYTAPSGTAGNAISFTQAMTLTSNGTFLVGKTSTSSSVAGFIVEPEGDTYITAQGVEGRVLYLNRLSSDGSIIQLAKDGTTVGSIGSAGGGFITIGQDATNLQFHDALDAIYASDGATGRDNAIDLGAPLVRFKDLYLSGGVYVGGTAAANHLDDYEEGTWTPTFDLTAGSLSGQSLSGTYVKIGRQVTLTLFASAGTSSSASFGGFAGLPFTTENVNQKGSGILRESATSGFAYEWVVNSNATTSVVRRYDNNGSISTSMFFVGSLTYFTA